MTSTTQHPAFIASLQKYADEDHARQSRCSWCRRPGEPYEYNGVRFDGLTACRGDRLCKRCTDSYLENSPLLILELNFIGDDGYHWFERDLNRKTRPGGEEGTGMVRHVITADAAGKQVIRTDTPLYLW